MESVSYDIKIRTGSIGAASPPLSPTSSANVPLQTGSPVVIMSHTLLPTHTDAQGNGFAGQIMAWMDICAGIAAKRHCSQPVVTASMDDLYFRNLCKLGDVVTVKAKVNRTFRTSLEVGVVVEAEDLITKGDIRFVCSGYFIFVALNTKNGTGHAPSPVPEYVPVTEDEKYAFEAAEQRRHLRTKMKEDLNRVTNSTVVINPFNKNLPHKNAKHSVAVATHLVLPSHANTIGVTFGGQIMAWMESCATISAMRHCNKLCIPVGVDALQFLHPVEVGEAITIKAKVTRAFKTSMEVRVKVKSENMLTGETKLCNNAFFTFIAVEEGKPTPVPQLIPDTDKEKQYYQLASSRRQWRLEKKEMFEFIEMTTVPSEQKRATIFGQLLANQSEKYVEDWELMDESPGLKVWAKDAPVLTIGEERMCCMRGDITVHNAEIDEVLPLITNSELRVLWDELYSEIHYVDTVSPWIYILHMISSSLPNHATHQHSHGKKKGADFCTVQCVHISSNHKQAIISEHSTKHQKLPKSQNYLRGSIFSPSGFVITSKTLNDHTNHNDNPQTVLHITYICKQLNQEELTEFMESQWEAFTKSVHNLKLRVEELAYAKDRKSLYNAIVPTQSLTLQ